MEVEAYEQPESEQPVSKRTERVLTAVSILFSGGMGAITVGVYLLAGLGWSTIAAGVSLILLALIIVIGTRE